MNHVFRIIWSVARGAFVVVSELASVRGKRGERAGLWLGSRPGVFLLTPICAALSINTVMAAGTQVASGNTQVYNAPNGVQVVDIATANGAGVSHNRYLNYNVDPTGQVLNNNSALTKAGALQSQLAGQIVPNVNLTNEAKVILNEVVAPNRSSLQGYTEVVGGKADVIVANPYGITCSGCGFINSDRATLTTGVPTIGADGRVAGFSVTQGDILVEGAGIDARNQQVLDLVARSVKLDGQLNGQDVGVVAGSNDFAYADRSVTAKAGSADKPLYAIDSTALGGMYANRIRLLATEGGVGVRMRGEAAASADDFTLTSAGKIELNSSVSAQRDLAVTYTGSDASDAGAITVSGSQARLSAKQDLALTAQNGGGVTLNEGALSAGRNLDIEAGSLTDSSSGAARFASADSHLDISGATRVDGSSWGAGNDLGVETGTFNVGALGATLYSGSNAGASNALSISADSGEIDLANASLQSVGNMNLLASAGDLKVGSGGSLKSKATLTAAASGTLEQKGSLQSAGDMTLKASDASAQLNNSGSIQTSGNLNLGADGHTLGLNNQGSVQADGSLTAKLDSLANGSASNSSASIQGANRDGRTNLQVGGALNNYGKLLASTDLTIQSASLFNGGSLESVGDLTLGASGHSMTLDNQGTLRSAANLQATLDSLSNGSAGNANAVIEGAHDSGDVDLKVGGTLSNYGTLRSNADLDVQASQLNNNGTLAVNGDLTLGAGGPALTLNNQGKVTVDGSLTATLAALTNGAAGNTAAQLNAAVLRGTSSLDISGNLSNYGTLQSNSDLDIQAAQLNNYGTLGTNGELTLGAAGPALTLNNQGKLTADGNLTATLAALTNGGAGNTAAQLSGAVLRGTSSLDVSGNLSNYGTLQSNSDLDIQATQLTNNGTLVSKGDLILGETGRALTLNNQGSLQSDGSLTATLTSLTNGSASNTTASLNSAVLGGTSNLDISGTLANYGSLHSNGDLDVQASQLNNNGTLVTNADLTLGEAGRAVVLNNQGTLQANGSLTATLASLTNGGASNSSAKIVGATRSGSVTLNASGALNNYALILANTNLTVQAASLYNSATAGIAGLQQLALTASSGNIDNYGSLYAGTALKLTASSGTVRNRSNAEINSSGSLTSSSRDFVNNGAVVIAGNGTITTSNSFVNQTLYNGGAIGKAWDGAVAVPGGEHSVEIADDGAGSDGMNADVYNQDITRTEHFVDSNGNTLDTALVTGLTKAQIIANGAGSTLSINYGASGLNDGAVISANTVNIGGSGTFTNQDLVLYKYNLTRRWIAIEDGGNWIYWARIDSDPQYLCYWNNGTAGCTGKDDGGPNGPDDDDFNWDNWTPGGGHWAVGEGWVSYRDVNQAKEAAIAGAAFVGASTVASSGAGIYGGTVNFTSGTLNNIGSPWPDDESLVKRGSSVGASVNSTSGGSNAGSASGAGSATGSNSASGAGSGSGVSGGSVLPGLNISLPTNPNGYFVVSKDPKAKYLVETNPNYAVGSDFVGSDYLAERYGYNPDDVQKRLGDANYEAYLIRQQLIQLTGNNVIAGYDNEAAQMQKLMDQAYEQGQSLGLEFGKALTPEQAANLTQDIVWMEEVDVGGQKVLAPRVYLAPTTVAAVESGAVISGSNVNIAGDALNNTGGTIAGGNSLTVKTSGDVTNTSGTLKGGDVSVTSTGGSVTNQTLAITNGDNASRGTAIGKTASIESSGDLNIDAAKDINVKGANVSAGGDASLAAGGNVTVDTIVDSRATTDTVSHGGFLGGSSTTTNVQTEKNIGSTLSTGGNLKISSGGDTVLAGSQAKVGGDLGVDAGGDFRVEARQDKETVSTVTSKSGLGVGGGLYGTQKTTTTDFTGTNVGSTLSVGGNADVNAGKSMVIQGSDVDIGGNASLDAKQGISVLDGLDEKRTTTRTETTTFLKADSSGGAEAKALAGAGGMQAGASAEASAGGSANLKLAETSVTTSHDGKNTSVASNLKVGGNLDMKSDGTVTVQGSNVEAGGNLNVDAKDVQVLTGRNEEWHDSTTNTTSVGIYNDASAKAGASASAGVSGLGVAGAGAEAGAEASTTTTIGARHEHSEESSYNLSNSASTLKSGGDMSINAKGTATFQGAQVESGGNMDINATDIRNVAAQDVSTSSSSAQTHTAGVYVGTSASASGSASASSTGKADAEGSASAEVSAGLRYSYEAESNSEGSVTQVTNSFKSGGNFTRNASDTITDQGTQVEAGGNITQTARAIHDEAVSDSSWSSSDAQSHDARIGVSAGVEASASASGGSSAGGGIGGKASYEGSISSDSEKSSTAVTSGFKAGGNISSTSKDETNLVGTQFQSGGDTSISAGSLDYKAAQDTSSSSGSSHDISVEVKVSESDASASASYDMSHSSSSSSTARTGSIQAGGNVTVKTGGDATFEGTDIAAGGKASVDAGGNATFKEARDTSSSSEVGLSLSGSASSGKSDSGGTEKEGEAGVGVGYSTASSDTARVGSISGGQGVSISSGKDTTLVGTQIQSGGDTSISAGGQVKQEAAQSSSSSFGIQAEASVSGKSSSEPASGGDSKAAQPAKKAEPAKAAEGAKAGEEEEGPEGESSLDLQVGSSHQSTGVNIQSAGKVSIKQNQQ
ncbi:hemagglutinin repeat-containing protein [Pseudomonas citronellolis]|uniref:two-partner secretion domain-containing protein n=1 Tax=Pseudomonas citronellolis TaxID=53408 RepID=UPI0023E3B23D|nr:hemagglutinin repeat-containing protein [Pseudomonas citronellolis]MDF3934498.1 hemagglutinin repeat-containing protein [Pseudomonas citronellolis]